MLYISCVSLTHKWHLSSTAHNTGLVRWPRHRPRSKLYLQLWGDVVEHSCWLMAASASLSGIPCTVAILIHACIQAMHVVSHCCYSTVLWPMLDISFCVKKLHNSKQQARACSGHMANARDKQSDKKHLACLEPAMSRNVADSGGPYTHQDKRKQQPSRINY